MLFPKEGLCDDGFEGSTNEHQIFREVFFGTEEYKKRCLITGVINFECDSESPALMVHDTSYGTIVDSGGEGQERRVHSNIQFYMERCLNSAASLYNDSHILTFHVVETTNQGITSCSYLQKGHSELDRGHELCEGGSLKLNSHNLNVNDGKDGCKIIPSPTSQESSVTKLLVSISPPVTAKYSRDVRIAKSKWKDSCFVELDESELLVVKDAPNDPRPILRYHINRLLRAAGWVIGRRKRSNKYNGIGEYVYRSPEGRPIREFHRAWLFCGKSLVTEENSVIHDGERKVWADLDQFRADLSSTLAEIEENLINLENISSLAALWCLLDPFANAVFIDKILHFLKEGRSVIPNRTFGWYVENQLSERSLSDQSIHKELCLNRSSLNLKQSQIEEGKCVNSLSSTKSSFNEPPHKYRKVSGNESGILDQSSFPSYGSDSTSELDGSCLFEVPVSLEKRPTLTRTYEAVYNNQDCSTSSLICNDKEVKNFDVKISIQPNYLLQESLLFDSNQDLMDFKCIEAKTEGLFCVASSMPRKKAHKKSKKISEMKLSNLYQPEKLASNANGPCEINGKGTYNRVRPMKYKKFHPEDDDLLVSAIVKNKTFKYAKKRPRGKSKSMRKTKSHKGRCKLLLRSQNRGGKNFIEGKWPAFASRTVLCWLIHSRVVFLNEVIQYRNVKDGSVLKDGFITRDGILCKCCDEVLSISTFKNHAGYKPNLSQPCLNLFLESGKPFTLCQLEAWSVEYKAKKAPPRTMHADEVDQNDDSCGRCGDGGELICCDNCPSTFHQACLYAQELPEGSWYCPHCTCKICGDVVKDNGESSSTPSGALKCVQCEHKYHEACLKEHGIGVEASETWFCGESCQEDLTSGKMNGSAREEDGLYVFDEGTKLNKQGLLWSSVLHWCCKSSLWRPLLDTSEVYSQ
ncbi:unnamed protein product [Cuscuta europaea]|uniref:PHD-type domain-containing protein n=1 Tax=Cuscuta europaea TaxID=41803 RepID=A0A9P0ZX16_CUSEU|nr:unnamed protein product [Cuscuta europaea]